MGSAAHRGAAGNSVAKGSMMATGTDILSLPARGHTASVPHLLCTLPGYRLHGGLPHRAVTGIDGVPQFLAASLRTSFLRYAVLLI